MRNLFIISIFVLTLLTLTGCNNTASTTESHISGVVTDPGKEGKKIFLVPVDGLQDAAHVDSTVIKNGKFEFTKDSTAMEVIRLDYHFRENVQELLVVTEPGEVKVTIGPNGTTAGTPQNDSLQVWKDNIIRLNTTYNRLRMQNDKAPKDSITQRLKAMQAEYKAFNKAFYDRQPEGVFKDFLKRFLK